MQVIAHSTSLYIEWQPPYPEYGNLTGYILKYTHANSQQYETVHIDALSTYHRIKALVEDSTYLIQVGIIDGL